MPHTGTKPNEIIGEDWTELERIIRKKDKGRGPLGREHGEIVV